MAYQYCHENDLAVNVSKTKQLAFGRRGVLVQTVPGVSLEEYSAFLGVIIDNQISWSRHIDALTAKLSSCIYVLKRIRQSGSLETAMIAYYALFQSHLQYGLAVWGASTATNTKRILVLQKRAVRILAGINSTDSCKEVFATLKIMTVISLYIKEVVLYVDAGTLPQGSNIHSYNTRYATHYTMPRHHLTLYEKTPAYMGRKLHNLLPNELRTLTGTRLKTALTAWLIDKPFYTLEEFLQWKN
ncbi:hypothetical protein J6590_108720 [Homalodisca vitripennis]|nr:hypothetical protein J6590_108720 [Homalodisca vitripennis]